MYKRQAELDAVFADCLTEAATQLSPAGLDDYLTQARFLGKMGRGVEPVLIFLQEWPPKPAFLWPMRCGW